MDMKSVIKGMALLLSVAAPATAWAAQGAAQAPVCVAAKRVQDSPIIPAGIDQPAGDNVQGPSLIKVPDWVKGKLGNYYLYFAAHKGDSIRLAYADKLEGPWKIHGGGTLQLGESLFPTALPDITDQDNRGDDNLKAHIASPDVHIDHANKRIILYYHGILSKNNQQTRVATSSDGIHFEPRAPLLGPSYFRVIQHDGYHYALGMPGIFFRSKDGFNDFERGPTLFGTDQRHTALLKRGNELFVFWTRVGDVPERIYLSRIDIRGDWSQWKAGEAVEILRPARPWEGADAPLEPSVRGTAFGHLNQLRDPAIYEENGRTYLLYAVGGESGIALAELQFNDAACDAGKRQVR